MAIDIDEIIEHGREVRRTSGRLVKIAQAIKNGVDGEPLHADTITRLRTKILAAKGAYVQASDAFGVAIGE